MSEASTAALEELGRQVAEAIARGEFDRARELTEAAIQRRTAENLLPRCHRSSDS